MKKREGKKRTMNKQTYQRNEEQKDYREGAESRQRELGSHSLLYVEIWFFTLKINFIKGNAI